MVINHGDRFRPQFLELWDPFQLAQIRSNWFDPSDPFYLTLINMFCCIIVSLNSIQVALVAGSSSSQLHGSTKHHGSAHQPLSLGVGPYKKAAIWMEGEKNHPIQLWGTKMKKTWVIILTTYDITRFTPFLRVVFWVVWLVVASKSRFSFFLSLEMVCFTKGKKSLSKKVRRTLDLRMKKTSETSTQGGF